jgi:hypothetical protein
VGALLSLLQDRGQLESPHFEFPEGGYCSPDNLTAFCEPTVQKMWEPQCLTTTWDSTACYRDIKNLHMTKYDFVWKLHNLLFVYEKEFTLISLMSGYTEHKTLRNSRTYHFHHCHKFKIFEGLTFRTVEDDVFNPLIVQTHIIILLQFLSIFLCLADNRWNGYS